MKLSFFTILFFLPSASLSSHGATFNAISGKPIQATSSDEENAVGLTHSSVNQAGNTVVFDNITSSNFDTEGDYLFDMEFHGWSHPQNISILITGGISNKTTTFNGKVTGNGHFQHNAQNIRNATYAFTGDVSEYAGSFYINGAGTNSLSFGNNTQSSGDASHILGTGNIVGGTLDEITGTLSIGNRINVDLNYSNAVTAVNHFNNAAIINNGSGDLTLTGNLENTVLQPVNGQIIIHRNATISGDTNIHDGTVALDKNSTMGTGTITLDSGKLTSHSTGRASIGNTINIRGNASLLSIDLNGSNVTITRNSELTLENTVLNNSTINMDGSIVLSFTNFDSISLPLDNNTTFSLEQPFLMGGILQNSAEGGLFILMIGTDIMSLFKSQGYDSLSLSVTDGKTSIIANGAYSFTFSDNLQEYGLTIDQKDFATTGKVIIGNIQNSSLPIPEPGTFVLVLISSIALITRRMR